MGHWRCSIQHGGRHTRFRLPAHLIVLNSESRDQLHRLTFPIRCIRTDRCSLQHKTMEHERSPSLLFKNRYFAESNSLPFATPRLPIAQNASLYSSPMSDLSQNNPSEAIGDVDEVTGQSVGRSLIDSLRRRLTPGSQVQQGDQLMDQSRKMLHRHLQLIDRNDKVHIRQHYDGSVHRHLRCIAGW